MELVVAIFVLSILILIHEFGHFVMARRSGMLVEEFGIGLPPRVWGKKIGETIYSLNALPLGGFVKIYGESGPTEGGQPRRVAVGAPTEASEMSAQDESRAFYTKPAGARFAVLAAGVAMNIVLGVLLFSILYTAGLPAAVTERNRPNLENMHLEIAEVRKGSPAGMVGMKAGDAIQKLGFGNEVLMPKTVPDVQQFVEQYGGKEIVVEILRNGTVVELRTVPREKPPEGQGPLGIALLEVGTLRYSWYRSIGEAVLTSGEIAWRVVAGLGRIVKDLATEGRIDSGVAGPIGIVGVAGEAARLGFTRLMLFTALITINLAVLNFLPIPALDGGRVLFLAIEKVRGKPISRKFEALSHAAGMAVLLTLILLVSIQDIRRLF